MARLIKRVFRRIGIVFDARSLSFKAGGRRYTPSKFSYPTTEDAWCSDWENIGKDFRRAVARFESEVVNV